MKKVNYLVGMIFLLAVMAVVPTSISAERIDTMTMTYLPMEEEHPDPSEEEHPEPSEEEHPDPS